MSAQSSIEWTDATWNPIRAARHQDSFGDVVAGRTLLNGKSFIGWHCEHVSEGCRNCYAERMNKRLGTGLDFKPGHRKDIEIFLDEKMLTAPLRWKTPRRIFVGSMTDLFADFVTDAWIDRMFAVMALCPQHTFQILTKRPERMETYISAIVDTFHASPDGMDVRFGAICTDITASPCAASAFEDVDWPLPNVWLGTSVEDQDRANERIPHLRATPAAVRFLSGEPLLGEIDILKFCVEETSTAYRLLSSFYGPDGFDESGSQPERTLKPIKPCPIDWVICGGESGPHARPMHPDWARSLRDQCTAAGVKFFFKQWGEWCAFDDADRDWFAERKASGLFDGRRDISDAVGWPMQRVGKRTAGRLLDSREWNEMPEVVRA